MAEKKSDGLKVGSRVRWATINRSGNGKIVDVHETKKGAYYEVDIGSLGKPLKLRAAYLTKV